MKRANDYSPLRVQKYGIRNTSLGEGRKRKGAITWNRPYGMRNLEFKILYAFRFARLPAIALAKAG